MKSLNFVRECIPNIEFLELCQVSDLGRESPAELVARYCEVLKELPLAVHRWDAACEVVSSQVQVAQSRHLGHNDGKRARHVVVVEVEDLEVLQEGELGWKGFIEEIVGEVEGAKGGEGGDLRRDGAGDVEAGEIQGGHVAGAGAARDTRPEAVGDGGVPPGHLRLRGGGVEGEGGLDGEKGPELEEVRGSSRGEVEVER